MRPQAFPESHGIREHAQTYRFDMAYTAQDTIASCRVEIYAAGVLGAGSPLAVVISDTPGSLPPTAP